MEQKPIESHWISRPFLFLTSMVQDGLFEFSQGIKQTTAEYVYLLNIKKQNAELKNLNNEMTARLLQMKELDIENQHLRGLLDLKEKSKMSLIAAQVIGRDLIKDHKKITINKGTKHGLKNGQAVITLNGVVGYVFRPQLLTSDVMLVTDRYSVVDGLIQRTRASGIVEGKGAQTLLMNYVERTEDVQAGDIVVTGGLDNIFPKGFPIAVVENVERKTMSISLKVELKPVIDPAVVEDVFIIANANGEEITPPTPPATAIAPTPESPSKNPTTAPNTPHGNSQSPAVSSKTQ